MRCATSRPSGSGCTCAGAIIRGRTIATCRSPTSSTSSGPRSRATILFEAANPRHAHEYALFESVGVPEGKILAPGLIEPQSTYIEHPELIAQRIGRYADLVGRERVIGGVDCGFSVHVGSGGLDPGSGLGEAGGARRGRGDRQRPLLALTAHAAISAAKEATIVIIGCGMAEVAQMAAGEPGAAGVRDAVSQSVADQLAPGDVLFAGKDERGRGDLAEPVRDRRQRRLAGEQVAAVIAGQSASARPSISGWAAQRAFISSSRPARTSAA